MTRVLTVMEQLLVSEFPIDLEVQNEIREWLNNPDFLDRKRSFETFHELDVLPISHEFMTDASDYAVGVYNCQSKDSYRRQFNLEESQHLIIAEKEALAMKLCIENIPLKPPPHHVRVHVDNQNCVFAFKNLGGRNSYITRVIKWMWEWQKDHNCLISIVYVNTHDNLSDEASRIIDIADETCASPLLIKVITQNSLRYFQIKTIYLDSREKF